MGSGKPQGWFTGDYYTASLKTNSLEKWEETLVNAGHISRDPLKDKDLNREMTDRPRTELKPCLHPLLSAGSLRRGKVQLSRSGPLAPPNLFPSEGLGGYHLLLISQLQNLDAFRISFPGKGAGS